MSVNGQGKSFSYPSGKSNINHYQPQKTSEYGEFNHAAINTPASVLWKCQIQL